MRKTVLLLALASLVATGGPAVAEIGTIDDVPAATLLLPYFELDLAECDAPGSSITTLFSINNATAAPTLAHVTLWTDMSVPTLDFDVWLTGFDVQTINLRDIFCSGILPQTGFTTTVAAFDPGSCLDRDDVAGGLPLDCVTGPFSFTVVDTDPFPACASSLPFPKPALPLSFYQGHLQAAHTGGCSSLFLDITGTDCFAGLDYGDGVARGYITVDNASDCNLFFPNDANYWTGNLTRENNVLWGDYIYLDNANNAAQGETLVHVEACPDGRDGPLVYDGFVGTGAACPLDSVVAADYTFYARYSNTSVSDAREPLATTFATRYFSGGGFDGGTELIVWRDSTDALSVPSDDPVAPGNLEFPWFPLEETQVVAFNEIEDAVELCGGFTEDIVSPPVGAIFEVCFPAEAQRVVLGEIPSRIPFADDLTPPFNFGWLYLNLNAQVLRPPNDLALAIGGTSQNWVTTIATGLGRFSVGWDAIQLDNANETSGSAGVVLVPVP